jgi:hypothetical protein
MFIKTVSPTAENSDERSESLCSPKVTQNPTGCDVSLSGQYFAFTGDWQNNQICWTCLLIISIQCNYAGWYYVYLIFCEFCMIKNGGYLK